jgi:hypothetical protein
VLFFPVPAEWVVDRREDSFANGHEVESIPSGPDPRLA